MTDTLHDNVPEHDDDVETRPTGVTRRELFQIGNVLALPVLLGGVKASAEVEAAMGPLTPGPQIYQSIGVEPITPLDPRV